MRETRKNNKEKRVGQGRHRTGRQRTTEKTGQGGNTEERKHT
jgi:hypothetical protein